ncbi:hypothetical protein IF1G_02526 [Cordyceps javanica]|uniref:Uncharacterized protein n=1 Tax=Cordyceps javanica TaxID=43265 RepID=A0A545V9P0_9HYPO|nr:hypothetical protein IF1G_02526 [Cordyceps javanica]
MMHMHGTSPTRRSQKARATRHALHAGYIPQFYIAASSVPGTSKALYNLYTQVARLLGCRPFSLSDLETRMNGTCSLFACLPCCVARLLQVEPMKDGMARRHRRPRLPSCPHSWWAVSWHSQPHGNNQILKSSGPPKKSPV